MKNISSGTYSQQISGKNSESSLPTQINAERLLQTNHQHQQEFVRNIHINKHLEHLNNTNKHKRKTCMTTHRRKKTSPEAENENHLFREPSSD